MQGLIKSRLLTLCEASAEQRRPNLLITCNLRTRRRYNFNRNILIWTGTWTLNLYNSPQSADKWKWGQQSVGRLSPSLGSISTCRTPQRKWASLRLWSGTVFIERLKYPATYSPECSVSLKAHAWLFIFHAASTLGMMILGVTTTWLMSALCKLTEATGMTVSSCSILSTLRGSLQTWVR